MTGSVRDSQQPIFIRAKREQADTEEEILQHAAAHARMVHNMQEIPAEVITAVRAAIRETQSPYNSR
jgi:predicted small metal-binding protein